MNDIVIHPSYFPSISHFVAIANAEKDTAGSATIKFNITKTDNVITDVKADFSVTLTGFPAGSSVTISHIHVGAAGANGAIIVDTTLTSGQTTLTGGAGSFTKTGISVTPDVANSIINSPASYYFNVHSDMNKSGVIRGQLNGVTGVGSTAGGGSGGSGGTGGTGGTGGPTYEDPYAQ